jgi:hypothetical protein
MGKRGCVKRRRQLTLLWGTVAHVVDLVLDLSVLRQLLADGRSGEAATSIAIMVVSQVLSAVAMLYDERRKAVALTRPGALSFVLQLLQLNIFVEAFRSWRSPSSRKTTKYRELKKWTGALEASPQALLQSYLLLCRPGRTDALLLASVGSSLATAAWSIAGNEAHVASTSPYFFRLLAFRLSEVSSRVLSLALLAALGGLHAAGALLLADWGAQAALVYAHRKTHTHHSAGVGRCAAAVFSIVFTVVHFIGLSERPIYIPHRWHYALRGADLLLLLGCCWGMPARMGALAAQHGLVLALLGGAAVAHFAMLPSMLRRAERQWATVHARGEAADDKNGRAGRLGGLARNGLLTGAVTLPFSRGEGSNLSFDGDAEEDITEIMGGVVELTVVSTWERMSGNRPPMRAEDMPHIFSRPVQVLRQNALSRGISAFRARAARLGSNLGMRSSSSMHSSRSSRRSPTAPPSPRSGPVTSVADIMEAEVNGVEVQEVYSSKA